MKVSQKPPVHAANLVANNGNTVYGVDVIVAPAPPRHGWPTFAHLITEGDFKNVKLPLLYSLY